MVRGTRNLLPLLCVLSLMLLSACGRGDEAEKPEIRPVRTVTIAEGAAGGTVSLSGRVQAQAEINQSFRIGGRLIERTVDVGDNVRRGQLLARLDAINEESMLQSSRAQWAAAQAQSVQARAQYERMRGLVAQNAVSRAQFEQAEALMKVAASQLESARSGLSLSENRMGYTQLHASEAGVVTARGPEPGEMVSAGGMVVQIAGQGGRDAVFDVPAQVINSVPRNPDIRVALASDPAVTAIGKVREVSPRADPVTGTFQVRVRLVDPPPPMRLGSIVAGRMMLDATAGITVPATSLVRSNGKTAVWVVDPASKAVAMREIGVGNSDSSTVQVTSGLKAGDVVVTAGVQALRPGQKVSLLGAGG